MLRQARRRTLRSGLRGEDVRHLQGLLAATGHDPGPADGVFGARTEQAVKDFQRANNLTADGVVASSTWAALTATRAPDRPARGHSLHIGLNVVDDAGYGMHIPPLRGCENDARGMLALATTQGFSGRLLLNADATSANIIDAVGQAADELGPGDFFLLTYAGDGSQMPDATGDDPDGIDETWVAYDRQMLDDEIYALCCRFQPGVRILVISDSCHRGTVTRATVLAYQALAASYLDSPEVGFVLDTPTSQLDLPTSRDVAGWAHLREALREAMPATMEQLYGQPRTALLAVDVDRHVDLVLGQLGDDGGRVVLDTTPRTRNLPPEISQRDAYLRRSLYRDVKLASRRAPSPGTPVLVLAGCQDNQLAVDGTRNGLFTQRLLETWNKGSFTGVGYHDLQRQLADLMPPQQTPNLFWATPPDLRFAQQRPFTI